MEHYHIIGMFYLMPVLIIMLYVLLSMIKEIGLKVTLIGIGILILLIMVGGMSGYGLFLISR